MSGRREGPKKGRASSEKAGLPYIDGLSVVKEYLRFKPEALIHVYCKQKYLSQLQGLLDTAGLKAIVSDDASEASGHGPVWAEIRVTYLGEAEFFNRLQKREAARHLVLAIDHITDPQNLGSIARTAAFFGITEILVPKDRQVHMTRGALNAAQGAFALCDLVVVSNVGRVLEKLKESGYWIISTDMDGEPHQQVAGFYEKNVLVFGSEENGVSQLIRNKSDRVVAIQGVGGSLESLNVGVAAGILIHSFSQR